MRNVVEVVFEGEEIRYEWDVARWAEDEFERERLYTPRLDCAVGPFNITMNRKMNIRKINAAFKKYEWMFSSLNWRVDADFNKNPRCMVGIEYEKRTTRKHRLGSVFNLSVLAKVGIIVAHDQTVYNSFSRLRNYFDYLTRHYKLE